MDFLTPELFLKKIQAIKKHNTGIKRGKTPNSKALSASSIVLLVIKAIIIFAIFWCVGSFGFFTLFSIAIATNLPFIPASLHFLYHPPIWGFLLGSLAAFIIIKKTLSGSKKQDATNGVKNLHYRKKQKKQIQKSLLKKDFGLYFGKSTGTFAQLWHSASIAPKQSIMLTAKDAAQNILTLGAIGSGKTTRVMCPLLLQLFEQGCGGLIFDIKGDIKNIAQKFANITHHKFKIIGIKQKKQNRINLLAGLTPEVAASFLQSAFLLSQGGKLESFWIQTACELCRNSLGVLSYFPKHYNLENLYAYLFDKAFKDEIDGKVFQRLSTLKPDEQRALKSYCRYDEAIFSSFDEKVKGGVKATIAQVLSPFSHPDLIDAFCTSGDNGNKNDETINIRDVLDGTTYLVDLPLAVWGLGAKVIYTFIKLRFFNLMQNRQIHPEWNQDRPVFFMCDEYQEIVSANKDGLSDLNFWDKARTSNTIGIISGQSISSFEAAIGDERLTHALLQNFRQKICFKTEDKMTIRLLNEMIGKSTRLKTNTSRTNSNITRFGSNYSQTESTTEKHESVISAQLLRELAPNQSIVLLSINGHSMDDIVEMAGIATNQ